MLAAGQQFRQGQGSGGQRIDAARALGLPTSSTKFGHGAEAVAPGGRILLSSYHCSRYNQNTGRLDAAMFESVFKRALELRP